MTTVTKKAATLTMFLAAIVFVAACGGIASQQSSDTPKTDSQPANGTNDDSQPTSELSQQGYLLEATEEASFIKWTETDGNINGQLQRSYVSGTNPLQTESETVGFTGILEDSELTMTISAFGVSETWTGTLEGNALTLMIPSDDGILEPYTFEPATIEDYNQAASELRERVDQRAADHVEQQRLDEQRAEEIEANKEAVAEANEQLGEALESLERNTNSLDADIEEIHSRMDMHTEDLSSMQENYQHLQEVTITDPNDCFTIENAYRADFDLQNMQGNLDYFTQIEEGVRAGIAQTEESIEDSRQELGNLQAADSANESGVPEPEFGTEDVDEATSEAQSKIPEVEAALNDASKQVESIGQQAEQIRQTTEELVISEGCQV